jgi:hypothetical protein
LDAAVGSDHFFDVAAVIEEGQTVVVSRGGAEEPLIASYEIKPAIAEVTKSSPVRVLIQSSVSQTTPPSFSMIPVPSHLKVARWSPDDSYRILIRDIDTFVEDIELLAIKGRYYASREPCYLA